MRKLHRILALSATMAVVLCLLLNGTVLGITDSAQPHTGLEGKTLSILGDSISTYTNVSNNTAYNATLGGSAVYYTAGRLGINQPDTWWQQTIDRLGMKLLVNNSWSGSCIYNTRSGAPGAYIDRSVQLHNTAGEEPDIIAVYLGTNDFCNYKSTLGTATAIDYDTLISADGDGYVYATPATALEAYAIILHKAAVRYPEAEIYCFTLLPQRLSDSDTALLEKFNRDILTVAAHYGAYGVDLYTQSGIRSNAFFANYVADNSLHPGPAGMDAITGCFISSLLENSRFVSTASHKVTYELDNLMVNEGTAYAVPQDTPFTCSFTVPTGYTAEVTVTMEDEVLPAAYENGAIFIPAVTGDITITAQATLPANPAKTYRWEMSGTDLIATQGSNSLTRLTGTIQNGTHSASRYALEKQIILYHNRPWELEWRSSGSWATSGYGALLFAGNGTSATKDTPYLYRRQDNSIIAFGHYNGSNYHNYGVDLSKCSFDLSEEHTYRLENRVAADGSNMVWLLIDDVGMGAMNQYFVAGTNKNTTVDWVNGRDFVFTHLGASDHPLSNCQVSYVQATECVHTYVDGTCESCGRTGGELSIGSDLCVPGSTVTIPFTIHSATAIKSMALSKFSYDENQLELISGGWLVDGAISDWNANKQTAAIAFDENQPLDGTAVFALTFRVKETAQPTARLPISCRIVAKTMVDGAEEALMMTVETGTIKVAMPGDVNDDDQVTSADAIQLLYHTLLPEEYPLTQRGDMDKDGDTDSDDAIYLLRHALLPDQYPLK